MAGLSLGSSGPTGPLVGPPAPLASGPGGGPPLFAGAFATPGSPAKLFAGPPGAVGASTTGPPAQGANFSSVVPTLGTQLQGQFGSQLGKWALERNACTYKSERVFRKLS